MAAQGSFGIAVQIDVSSTPTALASVLDLPEVSLMKYIAESTAHDSTDGFYEATDTGKRRIDPITVTLAWDTSETTHGAIVTAFNSETPVTFTVTDPDGDETISMEVHIERISRIFAQEDIYKATVTLHPTGAPTIS
jgi:hypothetical protein